MHGHAITDGHWERIKDLLPGQPGDPGVTAKNNRLFIDAVLWIAKTGAPWRDLPERFGNWNSVWRRFDRWSTKGTRFGIFEEIKDPDLVEEIKDPDLEWLILDSTVSRAHQHAAGAVKKEGEDQALGRSRGGFSTKLHIAVDGPGNPVEFILTGGQAADINQGVALIKGHDAEAVIADKIYDGDDFVAAIEATGAEPLIPPKKNRIFKRDYDKDLYSSRQRPRHCRVGATHRPHTVYGGLHPPYECVNLARARYIRNGTWQRDSSTGSSNIAE